MKQRKPRLLDLFCGGGGAAMGYMRAGFEVTGVDHINFECYPNKVLQLTTDVMTLITDVNHNGIKARFDAIHASPPCQEYSNAGIRARLNGSHWDDYIPAVREALQKIGLPYVIENVPTAPLLNPVMLCGTMFGLGVLRHRHFECSFPVTTLRPPCSHQGSTVDGDYVTVAGRGSRLARGGRVPCKNWKGSVLETWQHAMGIDWINDRRTLAQAIPPAYTQWIGRELMKHLEATK